MADLDAVLARLRELHEKATPGPWNDAGYGHIAEGEDESGITLFKYDWEGCRQQANAELVVELRNALPALLAHIAAQAERLAEAERERDKAQHGEKHAGAVLRLAEADYQARIGALESDLAQARAALAQAEASSPADLRAAGHFLHTYRTSGGEICWQTKEAAAFGATDAEALEKLRPLCGLQPKLAAGGAKAKDE